LTYVQGATLAEAKLNVQSWFVKYRAQQRAYAQKRFDSRRESGLCPKDYAVCTGVPEDGRKTCRACREAKAQWRRHYDKHGSTLRERATPESARAQYLATHRASLRANTVLRKFDELGPTRFRQWLIAFIESSDETTQRKLSAAKLSARKTALKARAVTKRGATSRPEMLHVQH
jgi:hypothetical protein